MKRKQSSEHERKEREDAKKKASATATGAATSSSSSLSSSKPDARADLHASPALPNSANKSGAVAVASASKNSSGTGTHTPGAAVGRLAFTNEKVVENQKNGIPSILVRDEVRFSYVLQFLLFLVCAAVWFV